MLALLSAPLAALLLIVAPASAQVRDEEARGLYLAGAAAYDAGNFEDALGYFQRSYELSPHPELLFNIGQAADRARRDDVALDAFRRYLASDATIEHRDQIEARIRALEAAIARGERSAAPSEDLTVVGAAPTDPTVGRVEPEPLSETPTAVSEPLHGDPAPEAPVATASGPDGAGLALSISGGVLMLASPILLGLGAVDTGALADPRMGETYAQALARQDMGTGLVAGGFVSLGVGVVLLAVGVAILASGPGEQSSAHLTPNGFSLSF